MTYIRSKMINNCGPYYYEVRSQREGKTVRQIFVRYIGKHPGSGPSDNVVSEVEPKGYLEIDGADERKIPKTWDRIRYNRAKYIAKVTKSNIFQADGLAKQAWRAGWDPDTVDWDQLQGADLSYNEKQEKLEHMIGSDKSDKDILIEAEIYESDMESRRRYRESVE